MNRIKKDCELKEEFLKRPNFPNYLAPPPPPTSLSLQPGDISYLRDAIISCETPILPPLASPEMDILYSPANVASGVPTSRSGDMMGSPIGRPQPPPYYSPPSQNNQQNTPGFARRQVEVSGAGSETTGVFESAPSIAQSTANNTNGGETSRYDELEGLRGTQLGLPFGE